MSFKCPFMFLLHMPLHVFKILGGRPVLGIFGKCSRIAKSRKNETFETWPLCFADLGAAGAAF